MVRADEAWLAEVVEAARGCSVVGAVTPASRALAAALAARLHVSRAVVLACGLGSGDGVSWGAVDEEGSYVVDYFAVAGLRLDEAELQAAREQARSRIEGGRPGPGERPLAAFLPAERALLVQNGLVQGLLMDAAVTLALRHRADEVVVATPWSTVRAAARFTGRERVAFLCPRVMEAPPEAALHRPDGW
jgi:predicted phosphoribosyltransferase